MKKTFTLLCLVLLITSGSFAQKRNMIANSRFEDGYKNWHKSGGSVSSITFGTETTSPIAGTQSAKITIGNKLTNTWDASLDYFHPITRGVKYQMRFKVKATGTDSIFLEFCQNHDPWTALFRGWKKVSTSVQEIVIRTEASTLSDWNYKISFHLGQLPKDAVIWLDDVELTQIDGNWDGNLIPGGTLDNGVYGGFDRNSGTVATVKIDSTNKINGNSLHITKSTAGDWWNSSLYFLFNANEEVYHQISFKGFSTNTAAENKITIRTAEDPWSESSGDNYVTYTQFTTALTTYVIDTANAKTGATHPTKNYSATFFGAYKVFCGLGDGATPVGFDAYIDDFAAKELIKLTGIKLDGPKKILNDTVYSVWASPTHADNSVTWSIVNVDGQATVDQNGKVTPTTNGKFYVKIVSKSDPALKDSILVSHGDVAPTLVTGITVTSVGGVTRIAPNGTLQMTATVAPEDATNKTVTWSVIKGTGDATISSAGLLTATANGTVTVKATANDGSGIVDQKEITIAPTLVTNITVTSAGGVTTVGTNGLTLQMSATITPEDATDKTVTWSIVKGTGDAEISSTGLLTARANGTIIIKATANDGSGIVGQKEITVAGLVTDITISSQTGVNKIDKNAGTLYMIATVTPSTAANPSVIWSIEKGTGDAEITNTGILTAKANGTVTVKATATDGSGKEASVVITISNQTTGVKPVSSSIISFYPNPVKDKLTIDNATDINKLVIVNCSGQIVKAINNKEALIEVNTSSLNSGIYAIIAIDKNGQKLVEKFVKE